MAVIECYMYLKVLRIGCKLFFFTNCTYFRSFSNLKVHDFKLSIFQYYFMTPNYLNYTAVFLTVVFTFPCCHILFN